MEEIKINNLLFYFTLDDYRVASSLLLIVFIVNRKQNKELCVSKSFDFR